jgi:hypothetical protein
MANHHMPAPIICFVLRSRLLDNRVQLGGQEPIDVVRPGDRFRFGAAVAFELGPDARKGKKGTVLIDSEPDDILLAGLRVRLGRIFREAVRRD